jgi:hypothetical protein
MKTSILSPAHSGVVPSVCDAEAGDTDPVHDAQAGTVPESTRDNTWQPPDQPSHMDGGSHWYTFWKRSPHRPGRKNIQ